MKNIGADIKIIQDTEDESLAIVSIVSDKAKEIIDNDETFQQSFEEAGLEDTYNFLIPKDGAISILTWAITHNLSLDAVGIPMTVKKKV